MLKYIFNKKYKGDNMKKVLSAIVTFLFFKKEEKFPKVQIQVISYSS